MTQQEHDPLDTAAPERATAIRAEEERQQREKEQNDLRYVMGSKQGRRFVYRQLSEAGVWRLSFSTDNAVMAFNEGNRNRGLSLLNELLETCPDRYTEMLAEHKAAKEKHDNRHADRRNRTR